jgi:hypothetical protein
MDNEKERKIRKRKKSMENRDFFVTGTAVCKPHHKIEKKMGRI